jgi:hypothetical protein
MLGEGFAKKGGVNPEPGDYRPPAPSSLKAPGGFLPYRMFLYVGKKHVFTVRPEQVLGTSMEYNAGEWWVYITMRDNGMEMVFDEEDDARGLIRLLHEFLEADALRNQHNAALKKGKNNE